MLLIQHRVNDVEALRRVPRDRGVEVDIRDYDGALRAAHDPLSSGPPLEDLLAEYDHALLILNVKCDGLEGRLRELMRRHRVQRYFFLDCAGPSLVRLARSGVREVAVRFSEFEPLSACLAFAGLIDWVWVDCFTRLPLDPAAHAQLRRAGFRLCLVSPELQGHPAAEIDRYRALLADTPVDAVCTDFPARWGGAPGEA